MDFIVTFAYICISLLCLLLKEIAFPKLPRVSLEGFFSCKERKHIKKANQHPKPQVSTRSGQSASYSPCMNLSNIFFSPET